MSEYEDLKTGDIVAEALIDWKVEVVFGIPGDSINGFIEALRVRRDKIKFVLVRHEESAALMACGYAKYTGKLGVCTSIAGPGAIHLLNGLYDAKADNTPVIVITGGTSTDLMNSSFQQDVNLMNLFSDVAVYNSMIGSPRQAEMAVDIACRTAYVRRGVSHLNIPTDVQEQKLGGHYSRHKVPGHTSDISVGPISADILMIKKAAEILNNGKKIIILVGQGALNASEEVITAAQKLNAPIIKAMLGKAVVPDDHPYTLGGIGFLGTEPSSDAMAESDTLFMIGTSFPYIEYLPRPGQAAGIQIDIKPEKIGLRYPVKIGLIGDSKQVLSQLNPLLRDRRTTNIDNDPSLEFLKSKQQAMKKWNEILTEQSNRVDEPVKPQVVAAAVSEELDDDAIISVDSGVNTCWAARFLKIKSGMKFSGSGSLATMGCGVPYAIAAQIAYPERQSIAFVGDGGFTMLMSEFATAVQYQLPIKVIVLNNKILGMIRWEQMAFLGNPEYGIEFSQIDFVKIAEACGGKGFSVTKMKEVKPVIHEALMEKNVPVIVDAHVDPFEAPLPPKISMEFVRNIAKAFTKGQPYAKEIGLTLSIDQLHEKLRHLHSHTRENEK
ncbi:MAG: thiamine pyrophosphate-binding protein [Nitrososphaeraceae archaeon]|nr:thiamine pyrophosphate-binding protein [Nitrososphaeraceae archaeon]MDW0175058.1 thiamine pyrophosphate-binding protein [Nitrososphaeraceae archaeon]MDW0181945.1 thiamine pyrophosphate-binding protein [Nitrososphaeraceae archaeon]MDW0217723.1 thiamine pyrophosphate-binding protein [Nitrososphaeraceae archaeon]MDW0225042.1 thiamine pyrophosphate-binding protein [Nitrososphaeraceae archaeon]